MPVLCTTATANDRVVADVEEQLSVGRAAGLRTYRGPLGRSSLRFEVVDLPGQADRLAWLATHLPEMPGSGIVYTLTKRDADLVADWLNGHGVAAEAYSGDSATDRRIAVEDRLLRNDLKAVVATSALGMGYDKPDLGFVVHYQAPGSVIAYYQQVGRAGRGIERAEVVLLRGAEDRRIQDFFIEQAFPRREVVDRVLEHLGAVGGDGASTAELMGQVNLGKSRVEAMLKVLDVEGAVQREGSRWLARDGSAWSYDAERYERITALRRREQAAMAQLGADGRCLMRALQEELDDPAPDGLRALLGLRRAALRRAAGRGARARGRAAPALAPADPRGQEDGARRAGRDEEDPRGRPRRGGPRAGAARRRRLGPARPRGAAASGRFADELVEAAAEAVRSWGAPVAWVAAVPSRRSGELVPDFARRLAERLGLPFAPVLERVGDAPPQREMANSQQQVANVRGQFAVTGERPEGPCLLVDDIRFSGWTLAMVGGQLRGRGGGPVYPLALATAF